MEVEFKFKMTPQILYDFNLQHSYKRADAIIATGLGVFLIFGYFKTMHLMYLIFAIVLILFLPVTLYIRSAQMVKLNPAYKDELKYVLSEEGVKISSGELETTVSWDACTKAVGTRMNIIVYTGKATAFIWPRKAMEGKTDDVLKVISANMDPSKVKIRF